MLAPERVNAADTELIPLSGLLTGRTGSPAPDGRPVHTSTEFAGLGPAVGAAGPPVISRGAPP